MKPSRPRRLLVDTIERIRRVPWPRAARATTPSRTAIATVSYNTREHVAHLLFSVFRVLDRQPVERIVVVDNGSTDGTVELLDALAGAGLIELVHNRSRPYHGPGLNRALSHLARTERRHPVGIDRVWILDSDVIVLRRDALHAALAALAASDAVMLGQLQSYDQPRPKIREYAHPSALLLDPGVVWRHSVPAFLEDGAPGVVMQHVLRRRGHRVDGFPFFADEHLLHLGSGTLQALVRDERRDNRYHDWALAHREHHFHENPAGAARYAAFVEQFEAEVPELTAAALVEACRRPDPVVMTDPSGRAG